MDLEQVFLMTVSSVCLAVTVTAVVCMEILVHGAVAQPFFVATCTIDVFAACMAIVYRRMLRTSLISEHVVIDSLVDGCA